MRYLATDLVQNKFPDQARQVFKEAEELAPNIEQGQKSEQALNKWAVILYEAGLSGKAKAICPNGEKFTEAQATMDYVRKLAEDVRQQSKALTQNESLAQERYNFAAIDRIDRTKDLAEVREIAHTVINSEEEEEEFNSSSLDVLVIDIAKLEQFSTARKVAYAIEDDLMRVNTLRELATVVAWLGFFKEAFSIVGLKNGLIQFLDDLGDWICASETVEQKLSLEMLQETVRILGWTYPYWGKIYDQLVSASIEADFPIWEEPITSFNNQPYEELDYPNLNISNIFPTIPPEQAQRL